MINRYGIKYTLFIGGVTFLIAAGLFFDSALSQTGGGSVTVPTPKPFDAAIKDLKKDVPLEKSKLLDPLPRNLWIELSKLVNPAVVSITTSTIVKQQRGGFRDPLQEFLEEFYGGRGGGGMMGQAPKPQPIRALGTGFIIREDGLIITNNHVVEQADVVKVQLDQSDSKLYQAEVIGRDARTDLALIKIDAKRNLPVARLGSSKDVQVGEFVAAFGNPYGHAHTMTVGIISAIGREIAEINRFPFLQTDASINPGNSGGPLVNADGFVIGVNTAIDARAQGIGFAIPIDNVKQIVGQLEKDGRIRRGFIGVGIASVTDEIAANLGLKEVSGVLVTQVLRGGPADRAGIRPYDVIIEVDGKKVANSTELQNAIGDKKIDSEAKLKIARFDEEGRRKDVNVGLQIEENPEDRKSGAKSTKQYFGQKAPFDLGFKVADWSEQTASELGADPDGPRGPLITEVSPRSMAATVGLQPGDVILDVNRQSVQKATDVVKKLKKETNFLRIARGPLVIVVTMSQ